ncbi:MAG: DUF6538 domain-containing protein, partial [Desulfuromonadales bacterium]
MSGSRYLFRRNGVLYFRVRIPGDILPWFGGRSELKKSLRTRSAKAARLQLLDLTYQTERLFSIIRSGILTESQIRLLCRGFLQNMYPEIAGVRNQDISLIILPPSPPSSVIDNATTSDLRLSRLISMYAAEQATQGKWTAKTEQESREGLQLFLEVLGDVDASRITRQDMVEVLSKLRRIPVRRKQNPSYREKSITELVKMNVPTPLSALTIQKHMVRISSLFKWAVRFEYIDKNPAEGLAPRNDKMAHEARSLYSPEDLTALFSALEPYRKKDRPDRWWIPIIGLYAGMRIDEICQLCTADVRQMDGVWCFDINRDRDKKLKNKASIRLVPVHPKLIDLGFLEYCWENRHERLWPHLQRGPNGYSHQWGKWFQQLNRRHITT